MSKEDRSMRHFGPMHGERTRRHQHIVTSSQGDELIVSYYEVEKDDATRLAVEFYRPSSGVTSAHLTVEQAREQRDALSEFIEAWGESP